MAIKVTRNDAGNCITFVGSTNPVYWNSCLEGEINEDNSNNINVVNKIRTVEEGVTIYEFFNLPYTDFQDKDGNEFVSPSDCAEYITANANVLSNTGTFIFSQTDVLDAQRDATDTTVLFSNGDIYAVNSLTASSQADGTIKISTVRGNKDIYTHLRYYNVSVLDGVVSGFNTIDAAVDRLNEVLGGTTVGSNTGNTQTTVTTTDTAATFTVYGDRITETGSGSTLGYTSTAEAGNFDTSNGFYSNQTISENGEYFEFEQDGGDWTNSRGVYIGLFDETTYDVADLDVDVAGNEVKGLLYLRLYPTPFTFADSSDNGYGKINEAGFSNSPQTKTKFRLGRDNDGRVYIAHETSANVFEVICRSESTVAAGTELRFFSVMPLANELNGIRNMTVNEAVAGAELTWYYVESPDGEFYYPLFSSEADAELVDELYGTAADGAGSAHSHTFIDEQPNVQTWYMPDTYMNHAATSAPTAPAGIAWNEIQTGEDANYIPSQFSQSVTVVEGDNINLQIIPAGDSNTYSLTNIPTGLAFSSLGLLQGTAPEVTGDNVANPSDVYNITVTKANSYGSSVGTLTLTVTNDDAPASTILTPWTKALDFNGGSEHLKQVSSSQYQQPLQMNGLASTPDLGSRSQGETSDHSNSRPWATAVVFKSDGHSSNQIIWNQGEGSSTNNDNIYLRLSASGSLFFGWGREGVGYNECRIVNQSISSSTWYGVYVGHSGVRLGGNNASASNLANCFDIRVMSSADSFASVGNNLSTSSNWIFTGNRMDRTVAGQFTIGGRGSSTYQTYRGKVASMVVTTLIGSGNYSSAQLPAGYMPDTDQIKAMITDPITWVDDYKVRYSAENPNGVMRTPSSRWAQQPFLIGSSTSGYSSTQVWLMGDGTLDSYANGVRNYVNTSDQNSTKIQLNNMAANDFETVNIAGLT